jgi:D-alanyl-lipoteichoic acid acyltransferase DltB (MBOAT superfamily)
MLFNTPEFVIFLTCVLATITIIKNRRFQHLFILFASYFFYYFSGTYFLSILIASTIIDYFLGQEIFKAKTAQKKKLILIISLGFNLGLLGFFKYTNFAIEQLNGILHSLNMQQTSLLDIVLPIGISFYTFHSVGYLIDIYRGHISPVKSLRDYAIFVAFFPQLIAGPILRSKLFLPQLREKLGGSDRLRQIVIEHANLKLGITLMAFGFLKKMFFADNISQLPNEIFLNPIGHDSLTIILATITFGIQVYCDFSGYSDIAIGAALILGFKIPKNFNKPFFAISPTEFWRRWHISLSSWVRDYLYLPLVFKRRKSTIAVFASLMFTFFLLGLWHGAGWNFIIFGLLHGIYVAFDTIIRIKFPSLIKISFFKTKIGYIISILFTQYLIFFAFIAFRVRNLDHMFYSMQKFVFFDFQTNQIMSVLLQNKVPVILIFLFVILHFISYKKSNLIERISKLRLVYWAVFITCVIGVIFYFYDANPDDFIYFRF